MKRGTKTDPIMVYFFLEIRVYIQFVGPSGSLLCINASKKFISSKSIFVLLPFRSSFLKFEILRVIKCFRKQFQKKVEYFSKIEYQFKIDEKLCQMWQKKFKNVKRTFEKSTNINLIADLPFEGTESTFF